MCITNRFLVKNEKNSLKFGATVLIVLLCSGSSPKFTCAPTPTTSSIFYVTRSPSTNTTMQLMQYVPGNNPVAITPAGMRFISH